ncbi:MAG: hypothetical protein ACI9BV_003484, partial [Rhodothermales bacterium]
MKTEKGRDDQNRPALLTEAIPADAGLFDPNVA